MLLPFAAGAEGPCRDLRFEGRAHTVCSVPASADLRLFWGEDGQPFGGFDALARHLARRGERLAFATNGGMYHQDRSPVGLFLTPEGERQRLITADGPGNFGLKPNGVLCLGADRAMVLTTEDYAARRPECRYATQSGPMLVIDGAIHPRFIPGSDSVNVRGGVGVSADGRTVHLATSREPVNFHHFARLFRDGLGAPDALFTDGRVNRVYAPGIGRNDAGRRMGPILGLVEPAAG
ncbi:phosphodiester glycosidase family protein [Hasllibacter halocynthiae]|nr:phosphodiester glycosidase family protein [Hasllibacter halocynthiae]